MQHVSVECLGVSGAWISQQSPKNLMNVVDLLACRNADVVLLHVCENDCGKVLVLQNMQHDRSINRQTDYVRSTTSANSCIWNA